MDTKRLSDRIAKEVIGGSYDEHKKLFSELDKQLERYEKFLKGHDVPKDLLKKFQKANSDINTIYTMVDETLYDLED